MNPPKKYKEATGRLIGYSRCMGCDKFTPNNMRFVHDGTYFILCRLDYADYWENTDVLENDYHAYN